MKLSRTGVFAFHLLILPLLIFVGLVGKKSPKWAFSILVGIGIIGMLYHSFHLYDAVKKEDEIIDKEN